MKDFATNEQWINAITADPANAKLRLRFADWLQARGFLDAADFYRHDRFPGLEAHRDSNDYLRAVRQLKDAIRFHFPEFHQLGAVATIDGYESAATFTEAWPDGCPAEPPHNTSIAMVWHGGVRSLLTRWATFLHAVGKNLFGEEPVQDVYLVDVQPVEDAGKWWLIRQAPGIDTGTAGVNPDVFEVLPGKAEPVSADGHKVGKAFATCGDARRALSAACIKFARQRSKPYQDPADDIAKIGDLIGAASAFPRPRSEVEVAEELDNLTARVTALEKVFVTPPGQSVGDIRKQLGI